ncbi:MAG: ankyrin repeat domain-containing protein [Flavobacterium sp.]
MKSTSLLLLIIIGFVFASCNDEVKKNQEIDRVILYDMQPVVNQISEVNNAEPTWQIVDEFYDAIFANDTEKVQSMLGTTFPANFQPKNKITPLQAVIWTADNVSLVKFMVDAGVIFNGKKENLVLDACEYKRLEILKYLVEKEIAYKDNGSFNKAGFYQFYHGAKYLLLKGADQNVGDIRGKLWVFHEAVRQSDYDVLNMLKLTKDDLAFNECDGESALIIAIKANNLEMVKYLLKKGADRNKAETFDCGDDIYYGKLPVEIARANKFEEIVNLLK